MRGGTARLLQGTIGDSDELEPLGDSTCIVSGHGNRVIRRQCSQLIDVVGASSACVCFINPDPSHIKSDMQILQLYISEYVHVGCLAS